MSNLLTNPRFEEDPVDTRPPTGWTDDSGGWVTNDYRAHEGSQSYGNNYSGDVATSSNYGSVGVYPSTKLWQDVYHNGAYQKYRASVYLLSPAGSGNGDGSGGQNQYVWEDDGRLRIVGYDINNNQIGRWETFWMGEETYTDKFTWYKREVSFEAPDNLHKLRFNIDGGDGNNSTIDKDSGHGGNAGLYIDDAKLQGFSNVSGTSILQKGLVGHWTMNSEDVDSGKVRDRSPYDNHGTIYQNADIGLSGAVGQSMGFNGSNGGYVQTPAQDTFSSYTVSFWFLAQDINTGGFLISTWDNNEINFRNNGNLQFWQGDNSGSRAYINHSINENQWYHAAATWNGSQIELFVDGNSEGTNSISTIENGGSNDGFQIGQHAYGAERGLKAKMSDVRLYNRALSQPEIQQLANQRTSRTTSVGGIDASNVSASGGNEYTKTITDVDYKIHEFTSDGTFTVNEGGNIDVLIVAGGGGGGGGWANDEASPGGGAGEVLYESVEVSAKDYTVQIGSGGNGGTANSAGTDGSNSQAFGFTANGGFGGPSGSAQAGDYGGSGNPGGAYNSDDSGGGGGGAAQSGDDSASLNPGDGGDGLYFGDGFSDSFGENGYFSGGGGGGGAGDDGSNDIGKGGIGGGGNGGDGYDSISAENAMVNTGGGGGGGQGTNDPDPSGGDGGSGIVLIRYKK